MWGDDLKQYLAREGVTFRAIRHAPAYTSQEVAAAVHVSGHELAKTIVVKVDDELALVVLPASERVAFDALVDAIGARDARLAAADEFAHVFPNCEPGAMPPFGNLYGLPVYVAETLTEDDDIAFNAGSFTEVVVMKYADFARLVRPVVVPISLPTPTGLW